MGHQDSSGAFVWEKGVERGKGISTTLGNQLDASVAAFVEHEEEKRLLAESRGDAWYNPSTGIWGQDDEGLVPGLDRAPTNSELEQFIFSGGVPGSSRSMAEQEASLFPKFELADVSAHQLSAEFYTDLYDFSDEVTTLQPWYPHVATGADSGDFPVPGADAQAAFNTQVLNPYPEQRPDPSKFSQEASTDFNKVLNWYAIEFGAESGRQAGPGKLSPFSLKRNQEGEAWDAMSEEERAGTERPADEFEFAVLAEFIEKSGQGLGDLLPGFNVPANFEFGIIGGTLIETSRIKQMFPDVDYTRFDYQSAATGSPQVHDENTPVGAFLFERNIAAHEAFLDKDRDVYDPRVFQSATASTQQQLRDLESLYNEDPGLYKGLVKENQFGWVEDFSGLLVQKQSETNQPIEFFHQDTEQAAWDRELGLFTTGEEGSKIVEGRDDPIATRIREGGFDDLIRVVEGSSGAGGVYSGDLIAGVLADDDLAWSVQSGRIVFSGDFLTNFQVQGAAGGSQSILEAATDYTGVNVATDTNRAHFRTRRTRKGGTTILGDELGLSGVLGDPQKATPF